LKVVFACLELSAFSARHVINYVCHAYAASMTSVCPSVTLADFDHIVQQKSGNRLMTGHIDVLTYLHAKSDPDRNVL